MTGTISMPPKRRPDGDHNHTNRWLWSDGDDELALATPRPRWRHCKVGAALELEFAAECLAQGATAVCIPQGSPHYDLIVDAGKLSRVQVKTARHIRNGRWSINTSRRIPTGNATAGRNTVLGKPSTGAVRYTPAEIDCLVTKIDGEWFFFDDIAALRTTTTIVARRTYDKRGNWGAIGLPTKQS